MIYIPSKGQFTTTCSVLYPSRLFLNELLCFGDISCQDVCLLSKVKELDGRVG